MRLKQYIRISWSSTEAVRKRLLAAKATHEAMTGRKLNFSEFLRLVVEAGLAALSGETPNKTNNE